MSVCGEAYFTQSLYKMCNQIHAACTKFSAGSGLEWRVGGELVNLLCKGVDADGSFC